MVILLVGLLTLLISVLKSLVLDKNLRGKQYPVTFDRPLDENIGLYKIQGFGFSFYGKFRIYQNSYATYRFFSFLCFPIIPINCLRVVVSKASIPGLEDVIDAAYVIGGNFVYSESGAEYDIYSYEKWKILEVLSIYIGWYGYPISFACILLGVWNLIG